MKKKSLILTAVCAALIVTASIGSAFAYFSTYEKALGGYIIELGGYQEITEDFKEWKKELSVKNRADSLEDVYVRARGFAGKEFDLIYSGDDNWNVGDDGFYYYSLPLKPGESTTMLTIKIENIPEYKDPRSFNIEVLYECVKAKYTADGTPYADWTQELDVTYATEGDIDE